MTLFVSRPPDFSGILLLGFTNKFESRSRKWFHFAFCGGLPFQFLQFCLFFRESFSFCTVVFGFICCRGMDYRGGGKGARYVWGFLFFCTQIRRAIIELIDSQDLILYVTHATDLTRNDLYRQQKGWLSSSHTHTCNWWLHITQLRHVIATSTSLVFENLHPLESKIILQSVGETFSLSYFVTDLKCTLPRPW